MKKNISTLVALIFWSMSSIQVSNAGIGSAIIHSSVQLDTSRHVFSYVLTVTNPSSNSDPIDALEIDVSALAQQGLGDSISLRWSDTTTQSIFRRAYAAAPGASVLISLPSTPAWWQGDLTDALTVKWFTADPYMIQPGGSSVQFSVETKCLPGIRKAGIYSLSLIHI